MANKEIILQNAARDLTTGQFFALKFIDGGTVYTMYLEELTQPPRQPAVASQITATGVPIIAPSGVGDVIGVGTTSTIPLWTDGPNSVIGDSLLSQLGGNVVQASGNFVLSSTGLITFPDDVRQVFNPGATVAGLNVGAQAGNPSTLINGDLWYNSSTNALNAQIGGATVTLTGAGGSTTQLQYNNAGVLGGITKATSNGTSITFATAGISVVDIFDSTATFSIFSSVVANTNLFAGALGGNTTGTGTSNTAYGQLALQMFTTSSFNVAMGAGALRNQTTGSGVGGNAACGYFALANPTTGNFNAALGANAGVGAASASGSQNVAIGSGSSTTAPLAKFSSGSDNVAIGVSALATLTTGSQNVAIGTLAGNLITTNSGNVMIGFNAGAQETGASKLYIANSNTTTPLIGGDFATPTVTITGNLKLGAAGNGLYVKEGTNATMGTDTLNGATEVTITTNKVTANSRIFLSIQAPGGTPLGVIYVSSRNAGTSFGVKGAASDTSTFAWWIVEPA